jgi:hypothetical protein
MTKIKEDNTKDAPAPFCLTYVPPVTTEARREEARKKIEAYNAMLKDLHTNNTQDITLKD